MRSNNRVSLVLAFALAPFVWALSQSDDAPYAVCENGRRIALQSIRVSAVPYNRIWPGRQRPLNQTRMANFVSFDLTNTGTLTVRPTKKTSAHVLPLSLARPEVADDGTMTFCLTKPGKFVIDFGEALPPLHVFVDPPFAYRHLPGELYFGPGVHEAGIIAPTNGQTVCIDRGAVVHGEMFLDGVTNVTVTGRGVLDTSTFTRRDPRAVAFRRARGLPDEDTELATHSFTVRKSRNVRIDGITLRDTPFWALVVRGGCEDVTIDNVKVIGQWRYNSDGIDIEASENVLVTNCFVRSFDDCAVVLGPYIEDSGHRVWNVRFVDNDLWCDWGACIKVWTSFLSADVSNVRFTGNRLLHVSNAATVVRDAFGSPDTRISNIVFENMEVDVCGPRAKEALQREEDAPYPGGVQTTLNFSEIEAVWPRQNLGNQHGRRVADPSGYACCISNIMYRNFTFPGERPNLERCQRTATPHQRIVNVVFDWEEE